MNPATHAIGSLVFVGLALSALASTRSPGERSATDWLDAYEEARGRRGPLALELVGTVGWEGLKIGGEVTERYDGLRRVHLSQVLGAHGTFEYGCDGPRVWERDSTTGAKVRRGWAAASHLRRWALVQNLGWRELYQEARVAGREELDGRDCVVLELVPRELEPAEGEPRPFPDRWYLDAGTALPRRVVLRTATESGDAAETRVDYDSWKSVDGVALPHVRSLTVSGFTLTTRVTRATVGAELGDESFAAPEEVEAAAARDPESDGGVGEELTEPHIEFLEERHVATIRVTCRQEDIQKTLAAILPESYETVLAAGARITGQPLVRYHDFGPEIDLEGGIPIAEPIEPIGRVRPCVLPAGRAVVAVHVGPYDRLGAMHARIAEYLGANGLESSSAPWEEYWTDPGMEPDASKWQTRVVYPVH